MENSVILEEDTQHGRYLTFVLGNESFGLEIMYVKEIVCIQPITKIPDAPNFLKGIINLRGKIIPVVDACAKFGKEQSEYTDRTCIIVVDIEETPVGLIVDYVSEVLTIEDENIVPPPDCRIGVQNRYIKAIGKVGNDIKLLLDCGQLFNSEEIGKIL